MLRPSAFLEDLAQGLASLRAKRGDGRSPPSTSDDLQRLESWRRQIRAGQTPSDAPPH